MVLMQHYTADYTGISWRTSQRNSRSMFRECLTGPYMLQKHVLEKGSQNLKYEVRSDLGLDLRVLG